MKALPSDRLAWSSLIWMSPYWRASSRIRSFRRIRLVRVRLSACSLFALFAGPIGAQKQDRGCLSAAGPGDKGDSRRRRRPTADHPGSGARDFRRAMARNTWVTLFQHLALLQGPRRGRLAVYRLLKPIEPVGPYAQVGRDAMNQRSSWNKRVEQVRTGRRDRLECVRNGGPNLKSLIPVEHPNGPIDLKIAPSIFPGCLETVERGLRGRSAHCIDRRL